MKLELKTTPRGFSYAEWIDSKGMACSVQESSSAESDCIWLGLNDERMHLTQEQVAALLPLLCNFVVSGELNPSDIKADEY